MTDLYWQVEALKDEVNGLREQIIKSSKRFDEITQYNMELIMKFHEVNKKLEVRIKWFERKS